MIRTFLLTVAIMITASATPAIAVTIQGVGAVTCGRWMESTRTQEGVLHSMSWVLGYLSGAAVFGSSGSDPFSKTDQAAIQAWVTNYCAAHPLDRVSVAVNILIKELDRR